MEHHVLIVDDEPSIADNITYALKTEGFTPHWAQTGAEALELLDSHPIELIVLDIGLPDINGFELYRKIKTIADYPVIFLTARSDEIDRVAGLEMGADDYVVKPFSPRELTARIRTVLRRITKGSPATPATEEETGSTDWFLIDEGRYIISFRGNPLDLSRYEFRLLSVFIKSPGRVYEREHLMQLAWDSPEMSLERTVDTHVKTIRKKLREIAPDEELIITHRGIGYSLKEPK
jgi:two-component system catabolic regulation response regulator CreB